ncbi:bifunctional aspartate kinase/homoserine dehydrogenase I [Winogradskyella haliclonae]|uniref:Bifunctional aspartate kinase/homoserine dehydrogenase I n=1 Tax=Winogradskyella haliclonae TaxID=2048558 RepID=A0ABQ2BYN2_9FLAO|nr:bifunctional aspartate kinase/homoserine dehydrogenase I [Winogradskyella haliclonae]GGI57621.1 bifunctional aspartate kinase/homoserine dehydrogenase I [Winogradskyella haliclonae]
MKVLKFGGTSVGSASNINNVISILDKKSKDGKVIAVVSAVGGITDKLLAAGNLAIKKDEAYKDVFTEIQNVHVTLVKQLIPSENEAIIAAIENKFKDLKSLLEGLYLLNELTPKISDKLVSFGELMSSYIITKCMFARSLDVVRKNSQELIITNSNYGDADVELTLTEKNIQTYFKASESLITILPGFVAKNQDGEETTLGRGGSDFTASIIAAALNVEILEIWTDVSGMYTANPKLVKQAVPIEQLSFQEAMELSHFGAKVLYPPTVQPVLDANIPILIKNTMQPNDAGTKISDETKASIKNPVKGITHINDIALLTLQGPGMVGIPGFSKRLFETLANEKINVIFITQASSEHAICFGIDIRDSQTAQNVIDKTFEYEITLKKIEPILVETGLSIIALIGDNMKNYQGISGRMFSTLGKNNINVRAIAQGASERNISAVIDESDIKKALNSLHERFFEVQTKQLNVFIVGVGNVGERLIDQIEQQHGFLKEKLKIDVRIVGMANSRKMVFNNEGIDLENWPSAFDFAEQSNLERFFNKVIELNLRNSIFVDITADEKVSDWYAHYLRNSIAVVACNKIACSGAYDTYENLHNLALSYNTAFLYETNVGAGLPIINTLNNLVASGDKVTSIQAVLSGSLNFVFNHFGDHTNFHDTVKRAQFEGYTEPDPRIDLSGIDVARKILILARENGGKMEIEDIENESFLTTANLESSSVDDFYDTLKEDESHFQHIYASAKANNCQLKYVAEFKDGKAKVGLREIPEGHPFYNLEGKDNIVMFYTERYPEQPLIVKGAGAGADVTASGLFADIIKIGNK